MIPKFILTDLLQTLIVSIIIKGSVSFLYVAIYTYGGELFPSNLIGVCMGFALVVAKISGSLSMTIKTLCLEINLNPMVGYSIFPLISIPFVLMMPETLNKKVE